MKRFSKAEAIDRPIILASSSPRRKELLKSLGISFKVIPSNLEEVQLDGEVPARAAVRLAQAKALAVARRFPEAVVLGADTVVLLGKEVMGKPKSLAEAERMLKKLSGRTHLVITGFCLLNPEDNRVIKKAITTKVKMKRFSPAELKGYLKSGEPLDKAGAYAVQGIGAFLIKSVQGSYSNVVGLPLAEVSEAFKELGIPYLKVSRDGTDR